MIRSMQNAEKAMQMEQVRIDALANNLANVNSTGFKQVLTRVSQAGAGNGGTGIPRTGDKNDNWPVNTSTNLYHAVDNRPGPVKATGRETDVAILGKGFFVVQGESGDRYTRNGSFSINQDKELVTADGQKVLGSGGPIVLDGSTFSVENDGTIMVDGAVKDRLKLVDFADPTRLEHEGNNLLLAPDDMESTEVPTDQVIVAQGHVEGSNVNAIDTLVAMIAAQRAFEVQSKVLSTEDEMLSKTVNNLPRVG
jgi:flagellar basal-body rod protein FlgF